MSIWLEDLVRDAVLALRWRQAGDSCDPAYFVNAAPGSVQLKDSTASFLAHFIAEYVVAGRDDRQDSPVNQALDKYSVDDLVDYLEDQGYSVTSP